MQREIKFRAWDKSNKKMLSNHEINGGWLLTNQFEHFIPMQFTGLKDKNGKEIYEGDKVNVPIGKKKIMHEGVIVWKDGGFIIDMSGSDWYDILRDIEVIGNTYEPELVK